VIFRASALAGEAKKQTKAATKNPLDATLKGLRVRRTTMKDLSMRMAEF
jgi:hypothetical protein